ncbi:hypothetical protein BSLG_003779 [Batrachochytrium salamandrivorans]|nr:hypothetical protein BSLG_003779 [Batrachochytrium salamandrivorans]
MRVGAGIILSVLSSSVLAAVIPDYDSHGILLARRTVNPDPMDLLWKRADEKQTGPVPSSSGSGASAGSSAGADAGASASTEANASSGSSTGASTEASSGTGITTVAKTGITTVAKTGITTVAKTGITTVAKTGVSTVAEIDTIVSSSNPNYSSENSGLSKMGRFREFFKRFYMKLKLSWQTAKQKAIWRRGERLIKKAIKRVTEAIEGEGAKQVILEINDFLNITQKASQRAFDLYHSKTKMPLLLFIPKGKNQRSLTKAMLKIKNTGKKIIKEHHRYVARSISRITKRPNDVTREMERIKKSVFRVHLALKNLHDGEYKDLASKVGSTGNEKHIKVAEAHISEMGMYYEIILLAFDYIKAHIMVGRITFKRIPTSGFSNFKSGVKSRLGFKKKPSTGVTSNQGPLSLEAPNQRLAIMEEPNQRLAIMEVPNQRLAIMEAPNQRPSDENTSNPKPPGQGPSNQGPPDQGTSKQEPSDEKPSDENTSNQEESKQEPPDQGPSDQQAPDQGKDPNI